MELVHGNSLPEATYYRDEGCNYAPSCLDCPFPKCRYELEVGMRGGVAGTFTGNLSDLYARDLEIAAQFIPNNTKHTIELAERYGVSTRTVHRIAQRGGPSSEVRRIVEETGDSGESGKPTEQIGSPIHARRPWPVMPENRRAQ